MIYKIFRTDIKDPTKIELISGSYVVGRGKYDIKDRRISRKHGQFEVTKDALILTALHINPCFYMKKDSMDVQLVRQNSSVTLSSGDKVGLLPNSVWFEVMCVPQNENDENGLQHKCPDRNIADDISDTQEDASKEKECTPSALAAEVTSEQKMELEATQNDSEQHTSPPHDLDKDKDASDKGLAEEERNKSYHEKSDDSISTISNPDETHLDEPGSPSVLTLEAQVKGSTAVPTSSQHVTSPLKRSHDTDDSDNTQEIEDIKKIKTEPDENPDIKPNVDLDQAGPSNRDKEDSGAATPPAPQPPLLGARERCMYGANCYRRNAAHKAQYSHPQDPDWGDGAQAPCPYGSACMKRDPRHWRDHTHPPGKLPPPPSGQQVVHRQGNIIYINARTVNFYDDHFEAEDSDGNSVDYDYEF